MKARVNMFQNCLESAMDVWISFPQFLLVNLLVFHYALNLYRLFLFYEIILIQLSSYVDCTGCAGNMNRNHRVVVVKQVLEARVYKELDRLIFCII